MSLSRAFTSRFSCKACTTAIARSSSSSAAVSSSTLRVSWTPAASSQRSISTSATWRTDRNNSATEDPEFASLEAANGASTPTSAPEPTSPFFEPTQAAPPAPTSTPIEQLEANPLPWYLQNRPTPSPIQAAIIPDLPPNPPPLLSTLLNYLANTAGLDDMLLLDLRHLDPPPALGPKLIMLICTARSEKHLHVSADRFCRYLRREHHLRANAAGLLGRNELKIKLRRKAKRMKMLANVGGGTEPEGNLDDGIRTGWICCTVGKIEAHPEDMHMPGDNVQEFVGFRDVKPGVNVVVQMFTEEKRAEIDLETLWGGVLKSSDRMDKSAEATLKELDEYLDEVDKVAEQAVEAEKATRPTKAPSSAPSPPPTYQFNKPRPTVGDVFPSASEPSRRQHIRRLHSVGLRT